MRSSTTRRLLWECFVLVLLAIAASTASGMWLYHRASDVDVAIRERTGPMLVDVSVARRALYAAHEAATASFLDGRARLVGPGQDFYNQVAIATQSLAQAAATNGESSGLAAVRTVDGLLASYLDGVSQAGAHARAGDDVLAAVALWNAWRLLDEPGGIIAKIDDLTATQAREVGIGAPADQRIDPRLTAPLLCCAVSGFFLLLILVITQRLLRHRFRRRFNPGLLAATALALVLIAAGGSLVMSSVDRAGGAERLLGPVVGLSGEADPNGIASSSGMATMEKLLARYCGGDLAECGPTVARAVAVHARPAVHVAEGDEREVRRQLGSQDPAPWRDWVIPLGGLAVAGCAIAGFWPRFSEYRFRRI
jgi:hypothetical protein